MKRIKLLFLGILLSFTVVAQDESLTPRVAAYSDFRNYFYAFVNGIPRQLESQKVREFTFGGDMVAYVNNASNLIVWQNNEKTNLGDISMTRYGITNTFLYYQRDMVLAVWEDGDLTHLTYFLRDFKVNDQLIAFRDQNIDMLRVYHDGELHEVEFTLTGELGKYKAGKNLVAYTNSNNYFKTYLDGQLFELDNIPPVDFESGKSIVAYVAGASQLFEVFYNGKLIVLENIPPQNFQCGDELVAYVSDEEHFKVYEKGRLIKVESFAPDFYKVLDGTVLFFFNNQLQVIQNGERFILANFLPSSYQMNQNCVAWKDQQGRLFLFSDGKVKEVTTELIVTYILNGDVLSYKLPDESYKIYYRGKVY